MSSESCELQLLRACDALNREVDDALERAMVQRLPLHDTLEILQPILARHAGVSCVWIRTIDEDLEEKDFFFPGDDGPLHRHADSLARAIRATPCHVEHRSDLTIVAQRLDVAGEDFGSAAIAIDGDATSDHVQLMQALLDTWCEELDGYLGAIERLRAKHQITMTIGRALKHPVLEEGISSAIDALSNEVAFDDLILVYASEEQADPEALNYRVIRSGRLVHCSLRSTALAAGPQITQQLLGVLNGDPDAFSMLELDRYREDALVSGIQDEQIIGRLVVARGRATFNTFERDILERFADYLRHRIVDFNREWRTLARSFSTPVVRRLLSREGYREAYLTPREERAAVLYCDVSGFTRLSEQVLREPTLIGEFVDAWSRGVVDIVWDSDGVFDKMIGDCIIGLWGPPFFELEPSETAARALDAAVAVREFTRQLAATQPGLRDVGEPVGVAVGLNFCPLLLGFFGPNENYTGFSSGMNNTARLQGLAERDEILCMEPLVEALDEHQRFGPMQTRSVKNVAEPIAYRALRS